MGWYFETFSAEGQLGSQAVEDWCVSQICVTAVKYPKQLTYKEEKVYLAPRLGGWKTWCLYWLSSGEGGRWWHVMEKVHRSAEPSPLQPGSPLRVRSPKN